MPDTFYSDKLYPFMDRVLSLVSREATRFYLTGGTALSRHYLHHRYSDDIDLFVNQATDFREQVEKALQALRHGGIAYETGTADLDSCSTALEILCMDIFHARHNSLNIS